MTTPFLLQVVSSHQAAQLLAVHHDALVSQCRPRGGSRSTFGFFLQHEARWIGSALLPAFRTVGEGSRVAACRIRVWVFELGGAGVCAIMWPFAQTPACAPGIHGVYQDLGASMGPSRPVRPGSEDIAMALSPVADPHPSRRFSHPTIWGRGLLPMVSTTTCTSFRWKVAISPGSASRAALARRR